MGWFGYGIYDGDETQTLHYLFMKWAGWKDEDALKECLMKNKTKLTSEMKDILVKNIEKVLNKMPKFDEKTILIDSEHKCEYKAKDWHMLLALYLDNKLDVPKVIWEKGILGATYLKKQAVEFDDPQKRRAVLNSFIRKSKKAVVV
jgi:hypothetical protein